MNQPRKTPRTGFIRLSIELRRPSHRAYVGAVAYLRRIMAEDAPTVKALIETNLTGRDALGLADDYLDAIQWPGNERVEALKAKGRVATRRRTLFRPTKLSPLAKRFRIEVVPADPSRN